MNNNRRILTRRDAVILCIILLLTLLWLLIPRITGPSGAYAVITADGEVIARIPLGENGTYTFPETGDMVFTVENGSVAVTSSGCGDMTCVRTGVVSSPGEAIVCVPNKTAVTVEGAEDSADLDVVLK